MDLETTNTVINSVCKSNIKLTARKTILACMIGNTLEWYDFVIYGYFAAILGKLFFPNAEPLTQLLASWGVFWSGFIARPLGSVFFGHLGDKKSRKNALALSIFFMSIPTTLIGLLPTFDQVGIIATISLIVLRAFQGFALGGGYTGSMVFLVEHAPQSKKGLWGGWIAFSAISGVIIGSLLVTILNNYISADNMIDWGWRIPFLISVFGGMLGVYMRNNLEDPQVYVDAKLTQTSSSLPIKEIFSNYKFNIFVIILLDFLTAIGFFIIPIFMASYFKLYLNISADTAFLINTVNVIVFGFATLLGGWLSDHGNYKKILAYPCIAIIFLAYPIFVWMQTSSVGMLFCFQAFLAIAFGIFFGASPAVLVAVFPANVRCSGLSIGHNISMAVFGGSAPFIATWLISYTSNSAAPAYLLVAAAALSLFGLMFVQKVQN